jgi:hypothetical protein
MSLEAQALELTANIVHWINSSNITGLRVEIVKPNGEIALARERRVCNRAERFDFFFTHYSELVEEARHTPDLENASVAIVIRY